MRYHTRSLPASLAAATAAWLFLSAASQCARADEVSGTVTVGGVPTKNATLVLRREPFTGAAIEVPIDHAGLYRVFLEPGRYQANLKDGPREVQVVQSLPAPVRRDLSFGRR